MSVIIKNMNLSESISGFSQNSSGELDDSSSFSTKVTLPDDVAIEQWKDYNHIPLINSYNAAINTSRPPETTAEILESESAQRILPYLSLGLLSDQEKASLISLAEAAVNGADYIHNNHALFGVTDDYIAGIVHEGESHREYKLANRYCEARKLFCACLLDSYNKSTPDKKMQIRKTFFSSSPDFASYCGGLEDSLELLTISDRTSTDYYSPMDNLRDEIIYTYSFASFNAFDNILSSENNPIKQLQLLPVIYDLTKKCSPEDYTSPIIYRASEAFCNLSDSPKTPPLVRIVADSLNQKIEYDLNLEWIEIDVTDPKYAALVQYDTESRARIKAEQDELHRAFPDLPQNQHLVKIAPGVATTVNRHNSLGLISTSDGRQSSFLDYSSDNSLGLNQDAVFLLCSAHNPDIESLISSKLSINLSEISLSAQVQLLKFMTEAGDTRFNSLCSVLRNVNPELRSKLAESFLAADFGDDFGDSLLAIASSESLGDEEKERIFDSINSCRESVSKITGLYADIDDGQFTREYARATNERLTDAIMVFREIAERGIAKVNLGWAGQLSFSYAEAIEALELEAKSLFIISGVLDDVMSGAEGVFAEQVLQPEDTGPHNRSLYNFYSPRYGYAMLLTRPEGASSFNQMIEFGKNRSRYDTNAKNVGVEATISFIANPIDPFSLPNPYRPDSIGLKDPTFYDPSTMDTVSAIRLDREGRAPGTEANDLERNPNNSEGIISVDLAGIFRRADTPPGKIARLISAGNKLRAEKGGGEFSLNHNTRWFNQERYGTARGFREIVAYVDIIALRLCAEYAPGEKVASFRGLFEAEARRERRQGYRGRGRKASMATRVKALHK